MSDSAECSICHAEVDTWRHALFDCHMARCVWALSDEEITGTIISNRTDDAKLWMFWLVDTLPTADLALVLVTMWAIWWARRRAIHDEQFQSPLSTHIFITKFLAELDQIPERGARTRDLHAQSKDLHVRPRGMHAMPRDPHVATPRAVRPARCAWLPPVSHSVKINVDGGFSKIGDKDASAIVCRDKNGNYLGASAIILRAFWTR